MREASNAQEYERAARLRDDIGALRRAIEKQAVVLPEGTDADAVAFAEDELEAAVAVFHVRGGRVRGQRGYVVEKLEGQALPDLVESFLSQAYLVEGYEVPREILVPELPADADVVRELLALQRGAGRVDLRVPQRGDKRTLLETVERNAGQALALHRTKRASDLSARSRALSELQDALDLEEAPLRIECFDVSNLAATNVVASMVVFEDGLPRKSEYRRFSIRGSNTGDQEQNDVASIAETIRRRFTRYLDERASTGEQADTAAPEDGGPEVREVAPPQIGGSAGIEGVVGTAPPIGRPAKFAYPPNLVVVDGGQPQVEAAAAVFEELGITDIGLCGLAKRLEEVWLPGEPEPVILPRTSEALYLLQRVRDEAHRFAITYHRQKRSKSMVQSALDGVPGLGETRRKALLRTFGSLKRLRAATVEEVAEVPGIGPRTAEAVVQALQAETAASAGAAGSGPPGPSDVDLTAESLPGAEVAIDPLTGEILDEGSDRGAMVTTAPGRE
jgi:excinuclease ABC subunit C